MTERQVAAVLAEVGKLWHEAFTLAPLGGFAPLTVLSLRFGLMGGERQSYVQIEELCGIPRDEARRLENETLTRLAHAAAGVPAE